MAENTILVLNAGSSSLKFSLFLVAAKTLQPVLGGQIQGLYTAPKFHARDAADTVIGEHRWDEGGRLDHDGAIAYLTDFLRQYRSEHHLVAVGHRVVHGGVEYSAPVRVNAAIVGQLERLVPLAPLHQPHNLTPIKILLQRTPPLPQVACFDTGFTAEVLSGNHAILRVFAGSGLPMQQQREGSVVQVTLFFDKIIQ